jgi:hypothetical protein
MLAAADHAGVRAVVLDLARVEGITSRGFGAIASFHHEFVRNRGGRVALCGLSDHVRGALEVIRFIDGGTASPVLDPGGPGANRPRTKPLFEVVTADAASAVQRLKEVAAVGGS